MNKSHFKLLVLAIGSGLVLFVVAWFVFQKVFTGAVHLPQNLQLGPLTIQYYGLILAIAALAGYGLAMHRRKQFGIEQSTADNIILTVLIAGFIGARLYHVVSDYNYYSHNPTKILAVWNGGLGIYGVIIGGVIALFLCKKYFTSVSIWKLLDWLVPSVVLGQIIGRFGNFINYELYGLPSGLPWKMFVPVEFRLAPYQLNQFFHPLFLYESAGSMVILFLLLRLKLRPGGLFLAWLFMYNVMRFLLEQLRVGSVVYYNVRVNGLISLLLIAISIALYIKYVKPNPQNN